jgi:DNA-binding NtrC family response regulator
MSHRILIVDHDDMSRLRLEWALAAADFQTVTATCARDAIERIASERIDLVITERLLPQMNGLGLLWRIRAEFPSLAVIVMTAIGSTRSAVEAMRMGARAYLVKPWETDTLLAVARRAIRLPGRAMTSRSHRTRGERGHAS